MSKRIFFWGLSAGVLSTVASIIYNRIYFFAMEADYSRLINAGSLASINLLSCLFAATGFWLMKKWFSNKAEVIFNFTFTILSFASIIIPIAATLPLEVGSPELFPGLAVPMHFFPAMAWYTLRPLFVINAAPNNQ